MPTISLTSFFRAICTNGSRPASAKHKTSHVQKFKKVKVRWGAEHKLGVALAEQLKKDKAIMGIFDDEGCMGMFNAGHPRRTA